MQQCTTRKYIISMALWTINCAELCFFHLILGVECLPVSGEGEPDSLEGRDDEVHRGDRGELFSSFYLLIKNFELYLCLLAKGSLQFKPGDLQFEAERVPRMREVRHKSSWRWSEQCEITLPPRYGSHLSFKCTYASLKWTPNLPKFHLLLLKISSTKRVQT